MVRISDLPRAATQPQNEVKVQPQVQRSKMSYKTITAIALAILAGIAAVVAFAVCFPKTALVIAGLGVVGLFAVCNFCALFALGSGDASSRRRHHRGSFRL
jgi:1,4-dihydroxy-2-naphthoate octaprenyltransferase